jgi:predicted RNase H-like nuclease (RuvC/YqgF family)
VTQLAHVNLKLTADHKVFKQEQDRLSHQVYELERKNTQLRNENSDLKERMKQNVHDYPLQPVKSLNTKGFEGIIQKKLENENEKIF